MLNPTQITVYSLSQHSTTWWPDGKLVRKEAGLRALCGTLSTMTIGFLRELVI